ncbi:MAG: TMEM165/GDT1 family protein [Clostridia bacterium]|nr:TMEM165/GDT1 family protein [Clostridia bacterium]
MIFLAELGDKTQLLVLSFASKSRVRNILVGIALGSLFSHGIAIAFGSALGLLKNASFVHMLKYITYITFLIIGILGFIPKKHNNNENKFLKKISNSSLNYVFIIALCIIIGEIGDKTFLASVGLGVEYPNYKISLIAGAALGMVFSNSMAIIFGKILEKYFSNKIIETISNVIFLLFGVIGLVFI